MEDRIATTIRRLSNHDLTKEDRKTLKSRFASLWIKNPGKSEKSKWRIDLARNTFRDVQDKSAHPFFALLLLCSLTQCGQKAFVTDAITPLLNLESYEPYRFSLGLRDKEFLVKTAKEYGFLQKPEFIDVMHALFPEGWTHDVDHTTFSSVGDSTITYAYSKMPKNNLPFFLHVLAQATERSNLVAGETQKGDEETDAAIVYSPAGDIDCSCFVTVSRAVITEALSQLHFTKVYEGSWAPFTY